MYTFPNFGDGETVHQKSVFKADKADLLWNEIGTAALIFVQSEVDKTGKSYYGEMNLFVMQPARIFHLAQESGMRSYEFIVSSIS